MHLITYVEWFVGAAAFVSSKKWWVIYKCSKNCLL